MDPFLPIRLPDTPEVGAAGAIDPLQPDDFDLESLLQIEAQDMAGLDPCFSSEPSDPPSLPLAEALTPDFDERLAEALEAIKAGELPRADALYTDLLEQGCSDVRLFSNLGALALKRDQPETALGWLERGLALEPEHPRSLLNCGMALHKLGRTPEAIEVFRKALEADPDLAEAWNNLAVALIEQAKAEPGPDSSGDPQPERSDPFARTVIKEAIAAYRRALALRPEYPEAACNLAMLLAEQGDAQAGEELLRSLLGGASGGMEHFAMGEMLRLQGRLEEARESYALALAQVPEPSDLRLKVSVALVLAGQADQSLIELLPLIAERPNDAKPLVVAGAALQALGETRQAIEMFTQALALDPDEVRARNMLAVCHYDLGEYGLAIEHFRTGLSQAPGDLELRCNLAGALRSQGDLAGSMREMQQLLDEQPSCLDAHKAQLFSCSIGSEDLAPLALELGARYSNLVRNQPQRAVVQKHAGFLQSPGSMFPAEVAWSVETAEDPAASGADYRLRIGFLSAEIGQHVVGSFLGSFLEHYDRSRFAVELFAASRRFDATAEWMAARVDRHWLLSGMAAPQARRLIRSRRLDLLVETSGFTRDTAIDLLAERCAPLQCHYIGFHATTGLDTIDWFIGDAETVPESFASQFSEGLWRLPRPWLARIPDPHLPPVLSSTAEERPVLGSFNQLAKVREETLVHWLAALQALPTALLLIKDRSVADVGSCERIRAFLSQGGVAAERLIFLPATLSWEEHMACYNRLDVALDTTPWSSATTGFDALEMGVPLVAIRGGCTSARMSSAILRGLGRPEWIAESPQQFAAITAGLCADLPALRAGKQALREEVQASALFDGADLSRALEQTFTAMAAEKKARSSGP